MASIQLLRSEDAPFGLSSSPHSHRTRSGFLPGMYQTRHCSPHPLFRIWTRALWRRQGRTGYPPTSPEWNALYSYSIGVYHVSIPEPKERAPDTGGHHQSRVTSSSQRQRRASRWGVQSVKGTSPTLAKKNSSSIIPLHPHRWCPQ